MMDLLNTLTTAPLLAVNIIVMLLSIACYAVFRQRLATYSLQWSYLYILTGIMSLMYAQLDQTRFALFASDANLPHILVEHTSFVFHILGVLLISAAFIIMFAWQFPKQVKRFAEQQQANEEAALHIDDITSSRDENIRINEFLKIQIEHLQKKVDQQQSGETKNVEMYRHIFDESPIFYIALDNIGKIQDINAFACVRLGYTYDELIDSRLLDIVMPEERSRVAKLVSTLRDIDTPAAPFETEFRNHDHQKIVVMVGVRNFTEGKNNLIYLFCEDISKSHALSKSLAFQAEHDELTQLCNRRALESYFSKFKSSKAPNKKIILIYFDIDQLKVVNDTCGHSAGDQLLKQMVAILKSICDQKADVFARIGGDEFAVLKTQCEEQEATVLAEELRNAAEDFTFSWEGKSFRQSISVGVAASTLGRSNLKELLSAADAACYAAKERGRNQVRVHNVDDLNSVLDHRQGMMWVSRLDKAIKDGSFRLNAQPIIQLDRPHSPYIHYEVLLQYVDEHGNDIPPGNFLPSAERFGKSTDIDLWVMTETFDFLRRNPEHTKRLRCCSINITSHSIANQRSRAAIIALANTLDFPLSKICFEITETSAISNLPEAIEFIETMRSLGCRFALDDFGTGFSSFGYLKNLEVDYLKIDGSFIRDIVDDHVDKAMIRAISEIAQAMNIKTIAEYVENDQILKELRKVGIDMGQGFGLAKPMPMNQLHDFYHSEPMAVPIRKA